MVRRLREGGDRDSREPELKRQIRAIDKAQKQTGSRLLTSELRGVERQKDASDAGRLSVRWALSAALDPAALDAGERKEGLDGLDCRADAAGGDAR